MPIYDPQQMRGAYGNHSTHCLEDRMLDTGVRKLQQKHVRFLFDVAGQVGDVADEDTLRCSGIGNQRQPVF